jgi:AraC family L-rhamnose operon regulatory protein RhaS
MNAQDNISFYNVNEEEVKLLWFKPTIINLKLTNEVLKNPGRVLAQAEWMDFYFLMQFAGEAKATTKILSLHTIDSAGLENKIQQIRDLLTKQDKTTWPCRSRSYLFEILFCLARQEDDESPSEAVVLYEGSSRLAIDVIYYLQSRYNEKITIDRLAETFHTNRTTLISDFKKYTGQPVNQYLIDLRLTMAAALLRDTELSADEISERTGFGDISYFSRVFKKKLFYTPSEYRRMNKHKIY